MKLWPFKKKKVVKLSNAAIKNVKSTSPPKKLIKGSLREKFAVAAARNNARSNTSNSSTMSSNLNSAFEARLATEVMPITSGKTRGNIINIFNKTLIDVEKNVSYVTGVLTKQLNQTTISWGAMSRLQSSLNNLFQYRAAVLDQMKAWVSSTAFKGEGVSMLPAYPLTLPIATNPVSNLKHPGLYRSTNPKTYTHPDYQRLQNRIYENIHQLVKNGKKKKANLNSPQAIFQRRFEISDRLAHLANSSPNVDTLRAILKEERGYYDHLLRHTEGKDIQYARLVVSGERNQFDNIRRT